MVFFIKSFAFCSQKLDEISDRDINVFLIVHAHTLVQLKIRHIQIAQTLKRMIALVTAIADADSGEHQLPVADNIIDPCHDIGCEAGFCAALYDKSLDIAAHSEEILVLQLF